MKHLKERGITPYWYAAWHDLGYGKERKGLFEIFTNSGFEVLCEESEVRAIPDAKWTYSMRSADLFEFDAKRSLVRDLYQNI
jgi:hypothetical protein